MRWWNITGLQHESWATSDQQKTEERRKLCSKSTRSSSSDPIPQYTMDQLEDLEESSHGRSLQGYVCNSIRYARELTGRASSLFSIAEPVNQE